VPVDATRRLLWSNRSRDVVILTWPGQAGELASLEQLGVPRLLLIETDAAPPQGNGCLQDWIRMPATDADVLARLHALEDRLNNHPRLPTIDQYGELTHRQRSIYLSPIEQRLSQTLIERMGEVIADDELCTTVWPDGANTQSLRVAISRLRPRIAPLGLTIQCVRDVGYVMKHLPGPTHKPDDQVDTRHGPTDRPTSP
jgi:hypothetical protein